MKTTGPTIQNAFTVTRGIINLNNGGVSPSPRIVTEALVRYIWQQEDATAYTMWQILEPQSRNHSHRTRGIVRLRSRRDRDHAKRLRVARDSADGNGLQIRRRNSHHDPGLSAHADHAAAAGETRRPQAQADSDSDSAEEPQRDHGRVRKGNHRSHAPDPDGAQVNITGQITPVKAVCDMARAKGIETIVDGAHSFAQFDFKQKDLGCDYFGTSLHKWLYAPKGTGMLYVKRDKIEKIWPLMAAESKQATDIRKFEEIGTHSAAPKLAIGEAMLFHNGIGGKRKEARLRYLSRYWMNRLKDVPKIRFNTSFDPNQSCAIANVQIEGTDPKAVAKYLFDKHHIFTMPIMHEEFQGIRITPNVYTTLSELDRFCEQMDLIARKGLPA